jgi:hypothetical protein
MKKLTFIIIFALIFFDASANSIVLTNCFDEASVLRQDCIIKPVSYFANSYVPVLYEQSVRDLLARRLLNVVSFGPSNPSQSWFEINDQMIRFYDSIQVGKATYSALFTPRFQIGDHPVTVSYTVSVCKISNCLSMNERGCELPELNRCSFSIYIQYSLVRLSKISKGGLFIFHAGEFFAK